MDDIEAISNLGLRKSIPVHVDACLGSFVVALATAAGYVLNPFDFSLPGVTSISADTHKVTSILFISTIIILCCDILSEYYPILFYLSIYRREVWFGAKRFLRYHVQ